MSECVCVMCMCVGEHVCVCCACVLCVCVCCVCVCVVCVCVMCVCVCVVCVCVMCVDVRVRVCVCVCVCVCVLWSRVLQVDHTTLGSEQCSPLINPTSGSLQLNLRICRRTCEGEGEGSTKRHIKWTGRGGRGARWGGEEEADHRNEHLLGVELVQVLVEDGPKVLVQRGPDNDGSPGHVWGVGVVHGVLYHAPLPGVKVQHHLLPHHDLLHTREGEEGRGGGGGGGEGWEEQLMRT